MPRFARSGIMLTYPEDWVLEDDGSLSHWNVTIESPGSAFIMLTVRTDDESPSDLVDEVLETLKQEYEDLESEMTVDQIGGQPALGYDVDFITVDQVTTAMIRCVNTIAGPLLILAQSADAERESEEHTIDTILDTMTFEDEFEV